ncbi:hypothetical protein KY284_007717 [Solanum tuberosum]|nr:hypothetical protein KY284_007717 [Solanum tuberosum]
MEVLITTVYARYDALDRLELWKDLELVAEDNTLPWLVGGDFNVILNEEEKQRGLDFTQSKALDFSQCVNNCALTELKYTEYWEIKKINSMPTSKVQHVVRQGSDHAPFHLICRSNEEPAVQPFKFLNFWSKHPDLKKIIEEN